jgi:hypothetical protein
LVEGTGVSGENTRPVASHWKVIYNVIPCSTCVYNTLR